MPHRRYAYTPLCARLQGLGGDLPATKEHQRVDPLQRYPLFPVRCGHKQGSAPMANAGAVIPHIEGAQVAYWKTVLAM